MTGSMKKSAFITVLSGALLSAVVLLGGCPMPLEKSVNPDLGGMGRLSVTIAGSQAAFGANPARTMLAIIPEFSRYELALSPDPETLAPESSKSYFSDTGSFQLTLPPAAYGISAIGYTSDKPSARTWDSATRTVETREVTVTAGAQTDESLTLRPYYGRRYLRNPAILHQLGRRWADTHPGRIAGRTV
ncbi:MAG: hypothetical protein LBB83_04755 [Treponema sp.]|jgi:hypothetical protein|nr:hypothetical protein [Treponema sp.]